MSLMAEVIDIRNGDEQAVARAVTRAAEVVAAGGLAALPDEAGYQLIASISSPDSVDALLQVPLDADHLERPRLSDVPGQSGKGPTPDLPGPL